MKIGELARRSGLSASRIRFYEAEGLLNLVSRGANGYREYPAEALVILGIIDGAQQTGFSLDEIRNILPANLDNWRHDELTDALRDKVAHIERMERQLGDSKKQLFALIRKIERRPSGVSCASNTKRLLKEFVGSESRRDDAPVRHGRRPASRSRPIARTTRPV
jgi:DNA-binding transcriptional MerR regulator